MLKVIAISNKDLAMGFALAGIETWVVSDARKAGKALTEIISSREYGIVIMDEELSSRLDKHIKNSLTQSNGPLLVSIPGDLRWCDPESIGRDDYAAMLLRRAIGYQLNINL